MFVGANPNMRRIREPSLMRRGGKRHTFRCQFPDFQKPAPEDVRPQRHPSLLDKEVTEATGRQERRFGHFLERDVPRARIVDVG